MRDFHLPGRSLVYAADGMVATSHPLASVTALDTLRDGGTAADAAVAAIAALGVLEPQMTGIGGDCFCLVAKPGAPVWGYNGCGRSGAAANAETLLAQGLTAIEAESVHAVTVPGAVEAWDAVLRAHGRFGLERALQPAIRFAEEGTPVAPRVAYDWALAADGLKRNAGAARHFLRNGVAPAAGDVMKFPALAATLRAIVAGGPKAFYEGAAAADIVTTLAPRGSFLTAEDFARHHGDVTPPISTNYRGLDVIELPPNGQGLAALLILNILEGFDVAALEPRSADRLHLQLEAARLAYAVRDTHIADPAHMRVPVPALLDKAFARKLGERIDPRRRVPLPPAPTPGTHTVVLTVVDRDRTAVTLINSVYREFGVRIATEKTGILLHNRGSCFVLDPSHPNTIGPSKRPLHTLIPALAMRDGRCEFAFGVMGAAYQAMGHAQFVINTIDYGMDPQEALEFPRFFFAGETIEVERGVSAPAIAGLRERGHDVKLRAQPFGGGQAIRIDWGRGVLIGASDHRKDGCALGY